MLEFEGTCGSTKNNGCFEIADRGAVLIVRVDGGPHAVFGLEIAEQNAQDLMIGYLATTDSTGELPLYNREVYARALKSGRVHGRSTDETQRS